MIEADADRPGSQRNRHAVLQEYRPTLLQRTLLQLRRKRTPLCPAALDPGRRAIKCDGVLLVPSLA
jgi:hypothetical protein